MDSSSPPAAPIPLSLQREKRRAARSQQSIFREGRNIWRRAHCDRASFLIDADAFFRAFTEAALKAEKQIFIIGWDTDSRTVLPLPEGQMIDGQNTVQLGRLLEFLAENKPDLQIHVLSWDFAFIYLFERESLPSLKFSQLSKGNLRFVLDKEHPTLASHHQKIVVIDDRVAFSGGLDLTQRRWDTPEHKSTDARRVDPGGHVYGPFHDVQICVEGQVASALGEIARERWQMATGESVAPALVRSSPWPQSAEERLRECTVAVSRTLPYGYHSEGTQRSKPVIEVERLFLDTIRTAKDFVYIENQYFTSPMIARAIAKRLQEPDGPEFVMVLPRDATGWIEESTMGLLRSRALRIVLAADHFDRFRCYYPVVPHLEHGYVKVHSKVMVVDDEFVRVGSANLNNRSMGLDTECDLSVEAHERADLRSSIGQLRAELLAEHLGVNAKAFEARFQTLGSLVATVESFRGGERNLIDLKPTVPEWVGKIAPPKEWIDPSAPHGIRRWWAKRIRRNRHFLAFLLITFVTLGLMTLRHLENDGRFPQMLYGIPSPQDIWFWLRSWDAEKISLALGQLRGNPWAYPTVLLGFIFGTLVFIPIPAMILGVALSFPALPAVFLSIGGALLAALNLYLIGRYWAFSKSKTLSKPWVRRLSLRLQAGGVWAITAIRLTPIAPFAAVGIVAGGLRVPIRDYVLGTVFGLLPGVAAITFFSQGAANYALSGNWLGVVWVVIALAVFSFLLPRLIRRIRRREV